MPNSPLAREHILTLLAETPSGIAAITAGLTPAQLHAAPGPDEWSANDVLAHLRSCADVWAGCIRKVLDHDAPTIRAISPRTWIKRTNYPELKFRDSLQAFTAERSDLLAVLKPLKPRAWSRAATVTGAGRPLTQTVLQYAHRLAVHERHHLEQFARITDAVRAARAASRD